MDLGAAGQMGSMDLRLKEAVPVTPRLEPTSWGPYGVAFNNAIYPSNQYMHITDETFIPVVPISI